MGGADNFPTALIALLDRRMARFGHLLQAVVADVDQTYARVRHQFAALDRLPVRAVHGDLFGGNMLVDDDLRLTAVLDFGFLSTAGDPGLQLLHAGVDIAVIALWLGHEQTETTQIYLNPRELHRAGETARLACRVLALNGSVQPAIDAG